MLNKTRIPLITVIFVSIWLSSRFGLALSGTEIDSASRVVEPPPVQIEASDDLRNRYSPVIEAIESIGDGDGQYILRVRLTDQSITKQSADAEPVLPHKGEFRLAIREAVAELAATDPEGIVNGLTTFERKVRTGKLAIGTIIDRPVHALRAIHFVMRGLDQEMWRRLINQARHARLNVVIVQIADAIQLDTLPDVARPDALTASEFHGLVDYARANGLRVIPEIKFLTHQEKFLKNSYPGGMFNTRTYDPQDKRIRALVSDYLDELIEIIGPDAVHIGHDEVRGANSVGKPNGLRPGEQPLPAPLFLESVKYLHGLLEDRGIETWMWGDMLAAADEFPDINGRTLHGIGEYLAIRDLLPREIVICDWQYFETKDFPSAHLFSDLGFAVMGATWKRSKTIHAFSRYVAKLPTGTGMIATTWFEVQRGNWDTVERIIAESGEAFWYAR
jgi:hypothetical protein